MAQRDTPRHLVLRPYFFSVVVLVLVVEPGSPVMASGAVVVVDSVVVVLASGAGVVMLTAGGVTVTSVGAAAGAGGSACWVCEQAARLTVRMAAAKMARLVMWRTPEVDPPRVQRRETEFCCACW